MAVAPVALKLPGPDHAKVAPTVPEVPVSVVIVLEQVRALELVAVTLIGEEVSLVTVIRAVPQAVAVVTIRVSVPGTDTDGVADVDVLENPGPDQK